MPIVEERFDQGRVDFIRRSLQRDCDKGRPRDFEIIVDSFKVVPRTNDISEFDEYEEAVREGTRNVSFLLYDSPGTNRNTRYSFSFQQQGKPQQEQPATLGDLDGVIAAKLAERDKDYELGRLREKLEEAQGQLEEAEQYAEQLQGRVDELEKDGKGRMVRLGDIGASILLGVLRNSAQQGNPTGKALAGLLGIEGAPLPPPADHTEPQGQAFYQRQQHPDEDTRHRLALLEQMQQRLNEQQMIGMLNIIGYMTDNPQQIAVVIELLQTENQNPKKA